MNKEQVMNRFKDMVDNNLEVISEMEEYDNKDIMSELDEVATVVWTISKVTDVTNEEMDRYIKEKTGYTLKNISDFLVYNEVF